MDDSPLTSDEESLENVENFSRTVKEGRRPGLQLRRDGNPVSLQTWGQELLQRIAPAAALLDAQRSDGVHAASLAQQGLKLDQVELTPSAKVLAILQQNQESFASFALRQSKAHAAYFLAHPPSPEARSYFDTMAATSLSEQESLERSQTGDFDTFVAAYRASTLGNMSV
jgi:glutamate--cysteine ligase